MTKEDRNGMLDETIKSFLKPRMYSNPEELRRMFAQDNDMSWLHRAVYVEWAIDEEPWAAVLDGTPECVKAIMGEHVTLDDSTYGVMWVAWDAPPVPEEMYFDHSKPDGGRPWLKQ